MKTLFSVIILLSLCLAINTNTYAQSQDTTITLKVKGVTCPNDLSRIETNVEELKGVSKCEIKKQGATTTFVVKYNQQALTRKEIDAAVENTSCCSNPNDKPYKVKK